MILSNFGAKFLGSNFDDVESWGNTLGECWEIFIFVSNNSVFV